MKGFYKNIFWVLAGLVVVSLFFSFVLGNGKAPEEVTLNQLVTKINGGTVSLIKVNANDLKITLTDGTELVSKKETESGITETLKNFGVNDVALQKVNISVEEEGGWQFWGGHLDSRLLPVILIGFIFWMMFRQTRAGMNQAFTFGRSSIKLSSQFGQRESDV